jgi:hypothetical protein
VKLFECQYCGQLLYFENTRCERCDRRLGYLAERTDLSALEPEDDDCWRPLAAPDQRVRFCANADHEACNWMVPAGGGPGQRCRACRLNRTVPDLDRPEHRLLWQRLEAAKRRLVYGLLRLRLPLSGKDEDPDAGLAFDILADPEPGQDGPKVMTGHADGLITINLAEADDAERERRRQDMAEPYRTLLGHFRHEVGHYYWERLVRSGPWLEPFRAGFGDERRDYDDSLAAHHADGPPAGWREQFVSAYASAHPWEDWAETWAHYLHMVDTLETAQAFYLRVRPAAGSDPDLAMSADFDPYATTEFDTLIGAWLPLTYAVNSLNRSMGQPDLYPFSLAPAVVTKLRLVHQVIRYCGSSAPS